jgi:acetyl-CoA carboxylase biotin carboxyl carrier protein
MAEKKTRGGDWNLNDIEKLIDLLVEREISEFEMEKDGLRVHIKRGASHGTAPSPTTVAVSRAPFEVPPTSVTPPVSAAPQVAQASTDSDAGLHIIKSPIVGTFYNAPSPDAPPFVKSGEIVQVGQVLCIIEAMKLMNEIESEIAGEIVRAYVENGHPVEYGQSLFAIKPSPEK